MMSLAISHRSPKIILPMCSIRVRLHSKVRDSNNISVSSLHRRSISESPRQEDHQLHDHFRHGYLNTIIYDMQHDLGTCGSHTVRPPHSECRTVIDTWCGHFLKSPHHLVSNLDLTSRHDLIKLEIDFLLEKCLQGEKFFSNSLINRSYLKVNQYQPR